VRGSSWAAGTVPVQTLHAPVAAEPAIRELTRINCDPGSTRGACVPVRPLFAARLFPGAGHRVGTTPPSMVMPAPVKLAVRSLACSRTRSAPSAGRVNWSGLQPPPGAAAGLRRQSAPRY
jgi:hypothetical protein